MALRAIFFPGTLPRRIPHGCHGLRFCRLAFPSADCRTCCTAAQRGLLQCAFAFRQRCGSDYYSSRLLSHFLLHCDPDSRSRRSPACSASAGRPAPISKAFRPRRSSRQPTTAWPAGRRQTPATLCRPHRRIPADPGRRHPLGSPRLHRSHLGRTRSTVALYHFLKKFGLDRHAGACHRTRPAPSSRRPSSQRPSQTPAPAPSTCRPSRAGSMRSRPASRCHCRRPLFLDRTQYAGAFLLLPPSPGLVGHSSAVLHRRVRRLEARPVDQHLRLGRWSGTDLSSGRDGGCGVRTLDRRQTLPVAL